MSDGSYGVPSGLIYSFPLTSNGKTWTVVPNLPISEDARKRIDASADELKAERDSVTDLLGPGA